MDLTINNYTNRNKSYRMQPSFQNSILTSVLRTLDTNEMMNAVALDVGTMVGPRTYFDTKDRNKYAGAETFFREFTGTIIVCLGAGILGGMLAKTANKTLQPEIKINPKSWYSEDSIKVLKNAWDNSENNVEKYVENILDNMSGKDGSKLVKFKDVDFNNVEWFDEKKWKNFHWDNSKYNNIDENLKTRKGIINTLAKVISDKEITKHDKKQIFEIFEKRITNALKAGRELEINIGENTLGANISNILRDTYDMGKDVFTNNKQNIEAAINKIRKVNNIKIFGALSLASALGISTQYVNRKITEKRTGKKGFVGEVDYTTENKKSSATDNKKLWFKKIVASAGMIGMVLAVMKVKSPKDFVKKLQFTGPVSTGNAIKTVYAATLLGRFLASETDNELRESVVRDYFGFLNWLVLGGFAAKGAANLLDPKKEHLFNVRQEGRGVKHWLNDIALKTHDEISAQGRAFAKKNLWKLNAAHIAGLTYSTLMLGVLLPKINTKMTKNQHNQEQNKKS